jgi:diaminopropionate ammonia-lyase
LVEASLPVQLFQNNLAIPREPYGLEEVISLKNAARARAEITSWPDYRATPLLSLDALASSSGVGSILYKDESHRMGLGSFKGLGAVYAVARLLQARIAREHKLGLSTAELSDGQYRELSKQITIVSATDGNHGRAVAAGARRFGCRCVIVIHANVSESRAMAIAAQGAEVIRTSGHYDDAVREALRLATVNGWDVVSDTSWPGYDTIPIDVMHGYTLIACETIRQLSAIGTMPTHVFVQAGVGSFGAAMCGHFWERLGNKTPIFIVVEPEQADCLFQSALNGRLTSSRGNRDTLMAGLACGEASPLAWKILARGAEFFMTITDCHAVEIMKILARSDLHGHSIVAGESATAGLAGLLAATREQREKMRIDAGSSVLAFGTEGATDPLLYAKLVGHPPTAFQ